LIGSGFTAGADGPEVVRMPPPKGHDTDAVLAEAGYGSDEIAALRAAGAV
jgi:crotonobetainyl-CoA:carnitine CoA-transferase CaiB-like acyl-CoA transferase